MPDINPNTRAMSTKLVWVGTKLPHGLIMEITKPAEALTGHVASPRPTGQRIALKGANAVRNEYTTRGLSQLEYPFSVTAVPADFWEEWSKQEVARGFIKRGHIFVVNRERDAKSEARERLPEKTGLEPLNPEIERDARANRDAAIRAQGVKVDQEHLRKLQNMNGRD
jgi:hypothetical protein